MDKAKLLKIIVGESDKIYGHPLFEAIVFAAKRARLAGVTATRGIMSYGANSHINTMKIFALSSDLPVTIEIIDNSDKIVEFSEIVRKMFQKSGCGGIMSTQEVEVLLCQKRK